MEEMVINALLSSAVYPLVVASLIGFIGFKVLPKNENQRDWIAGFAVLAAFWVCFYTTEPFQLMPKRVFSWLPHAGLASFVLLLITAPRGTWVRMVSILPVIAGATWIFLRPIARSWSGGKTAGILALCALIWLVFWWSHEMGRDEKDVPAKILMMVIAGTGASLVSIMGGSAKAAQVAGGLAASVGALFLVWLAIRHLKVGTMVSGVFFGILGCSLLNAHFYIEVPWFVILIVALANLGPLLLRLPQVAAMSGVKKTILVCVITALPVIIALATQHLTAPEEEEYAW